MNRRRLLLFGTSIALLICAAVGSWLAYRAAQAVFAVRAYHQVALGMSEDQAVSILGPHFTPYEPAHSLVLRWIDHTILDSQGENRIQNNHRISLNRRYIAWVHGSHNVYVVLDGDGKVVGKQLVEIHEQTLFERLRAWLGL